MVMNMSPFATVWLIDGQQWSSMTQMNKIYQALDTHSTCTKHTNIYKRLQCPAVLGTYLAFFKKIYLRYLHGREAKCHRQGEGLRRYWFGLFMQFVDNKNKECHQSHLLTHWF